MFQIPASRSRDSLLTTLWRGIIPVSYLIYTQIFVSIDFFKNLCLLAGILVLSKIPRFCQTPTPISAKISDDFLFSFFCHYLFIDWLRRRFLRVNSNCLKPPPHPPFFDRLQENQPACSGHRARTPSIFSPMFIFLYMQAADEALLGGKKKGLVTVAW